MTKTRANTKRKTKDKDKGDYKDTDKPHYQSKKPRSFSTNYSSAYKKLPLVHKPYFHRSRTQKEDLAPDTFVKVSLSRATKVIKVKAV